MSHKSCFAKERLPILWQHRAALAATDCFSLGVQESANARPSFLLLSELHDQQRSQYRRRPPTHQMTSHTLDENVKHTFHCTYANIIIVNKHIPLYWYYCGVRTFLMIPEWLIGYRREQTCISFQWISSYQGPTQEFHESYVKQLCVRGESRELMVEARGGVHIRELLVKCSFISHLTTHSCRWRNLWTIHKPALIKCGFLNM